MQTVTADIHGRSSIPGMSELITEKRAKQLLQNRAIFPKPKNGITDPFTYYHILDAIIDTPPGNLFTAKELTLSLGARPIRFDSVTVGRIVGDISESMTDSYGWSPIHSIRHWDGRRYWTSGDLEERVALERLLEDLEKLCQLPPEIAHDTRSPLVRCPSVAVR